MSSEIELKWLRTIHENGVVHRSQPPAVVSVRELIERTGKFVEQQWLFRKPRQNDAG